jgi:tetratricopeptide (TPR) repeat protein
MIRSVIALAVVLATASADAQSADSSQADSAFRRRDWRATAEAYERIATRSPTNGMAWFRIGIARHALNDLDQAITAYEKALSLRFQTAPTLYRLARAHAAKRNTERAFEYLEQLAPMNAVPLAILDTASELAAARNDQRWKGLVERITAARYPCRSKPETRQFDFWIGTWDVTPWGVPPGPITQLLGTNVIEPILEHCVLMENWTGGGPGGGFGKSMNFYDTNRGQWRQIWVADGGGSLDYSGSFRDGAMRFEGWTAASNGGRVLQKLTFFPVHRDTVRQLFETSTDSGRTWQPGFDGRYVRRR